jgi:hypothetical protein
VSACKADVEALDWAEVDLDGNEIEEDIPEGQTILQRDGSVVNESSMLH